MRKILVLLVLLVLMLIGCTKKSPLEVTAYLLRLPGTAPSIDRSVLGTDHDFSVGYGNGNIRSDRISLSWAQLNDASFLVYKVFRDGFQLEIILDQTETSLIDSNLISGRQYFYKVAGILSNGGSKEDTITIQTPRLLSPVNIGFDFISASSIRLFWKSRMESALQFKVSRKQGAGDFELKDTVSDTFFVDDSVQEGETYQYKIVPKNDYEMGDSSTANITVQNIFNPPTITSLMQVPGTRSVEILWNDNANSEVNYWIFRDGTSIAKLPANTISYVDNDTTNSLQVGETYQYRVEISDILGSIQASGEQQITIVDPQMELPNEGFEGSDIPAGWTTSGDADWFITASASQEGVQSVQSGDIDDSQESILSTSFIENKNIQISFYYKVSSESGFDFLEFYINGIFQNKWSGEIGWLKYQKTYAASGVVELKWRYMKDNMLSSGLDCAWIDQVVVE